MAAIKSVSLSTQSFKAGHVASPSPPRTRQLSPDQPTGFPTDRERRPYELISQDPYSTAALHCHQPHHVFAATVCKRICAGMSGSWRVFLGVFYVDFLFVMSGPPAVPFRDCGFWPLCRLLAPIWIVLERQQSNQPARVIGSDWFWILEDILGGFVWLQKWLWYVLTQVCVKQGLENQMNL